MELDEKKLKKILVEQRKEYQKFAGQERKEYQRYLGVLKEDFDGKIKAITEQYADIKKTLKSHSVMLISLQENVEIMKVDIGFIKGGLKKKVDFEEFEALGKRVAILEAKLQRG